MRKLLSAFVVFVLSLLSVSLVSATTHAPNLEVVSVEINGEEVDSTLVFNNTSGINLASEAPTVEEGEDVEVTVKFRANDLFENVRLEAEVSGYEFDDGVLKARTSAFELRGTGTALTTREKTLTLQLPRRLEQDRYVLRLRVTSADQDALDMTRYVVLQVEPVRRGLDIADVALSPGNTVKAGRSLLATVLLENFGSRDLKDVKVTVAVPALGVSATEFVDVLPTDDGDNFDTDEEDNEDNDNVEHDDVPEMFLPLPASAAEDDYEVVVSAESASVPRVTKKYTLHVLADERFQAQADRLVLAVAPESQTVASGSTARYAVALTNAGSSSRAYLLSATTGDWASASLSEQLVVLESGKNKVVYVDVTAAQNAAAGQHTVTLTVSADGSVLETVSFGASVPAAAQQPAQTATGSANVNLRTGLEIALIVLVVVLVIVGLILGFSRLRKDDGEEKTYY